MKSHMKRLGEEASKLKNKNPHWNYHQLADALKHKWTKVNGKPIDAKYVWNAIMSVGEGHYKRYAKSGATLDAIRNLVMSDLTDSQKVNAIVALL